MRRARGIRKVTRSKGRGKKKKPLISPLPSSLSYSFSQFLSLLFPEEIDIKPSPQN